MYKELYPTCEELPKFYGLPKVHKPALPLRPIVASINSISYFISKYVANILKRYVGRTNYHVKNSVDFVKKIEGLEVPPSHRLVSFDVTALFTSIPVSDALRAISNKLDSDKNLVEHSMLKKDQIISLLEFVLNTTYFMYNSEISQQVKGVAMGSPVSPIVANLYMEEFEVKALGSYNNPPEIWFRYVDDTFCMLHEYEIEKFKDHLNNIDNNIKFTMEIDQDNKLPFLDTLVHFNEDGSIKTYPY